MTKLEAYIKLSDIFSQNGFNLYLVGGSVRDYLLFNKLNDLDVTTDATPDDVELFFKGDISFPFRKYGAMTIKFESYKFDVTTLRVEDNYVDSRHPNKVRFVKTLLEDVKRRDFTINGLYMDNQLKIFDYVDGINDLNNHIIKMIGNANERIKEDPLRILRAIRFKAKLGFSIDDNLKKAMLDYIFLLEKLNKEKIKEEIRKMNQTKEQLIPLFDEFHILYLLDMVN